MKFLIAKLSSLGDVVCGLPVATHLKASFPNCHITWVVDPRFEGIVSRCDAVDQVIAYKPSFKLKEWPKFESKFDAAIDLQGLLKSGLIVAKCKAKKKYGYHWQREGSQLFSQAVLPDPSSLHVVDQYIDTARKVIEDFEGSEQDCTKFGLHPNSEDIAFMANCHPGIKENNYVILNPGAGWITKRWPAQSFAELAQLIYKYGMNPILVGGRAPADFETEREIMSFFDDNSMRAPISLIGKTSIGELIGLISKCAAHIGGDTGTTHIAAALNRPAIGLYSITRPERSCPYRQFSNTIYSPEGLSSIKVEDVFSKLTSLLKSSAAAGQAD